MVTCAFATIGIIETANVRLINLHLIEVVLDPDLPEIWRRLPPQGRKEAELHAAHVDLDQQRSGWVQEPTFSLSLPLVRSTPESGHPIYRGHVGYEPGANISMLSARARSNPYDSIERAPRLA